MGFVSGEPRYRKKTTVTAREVERLLGISYNSAKQKLDAMVTAGILESEKIGKSTEYFLAWELKSLGYIVEEANELFA